MGSSSSVSDGIPSGELGGVKYPDSDIETEDDLSESGYFTPPNSPEGIPSLTEDEEDSLMSEENWGLPLLSDSEDEDDDIPVHHHLTNVLNPLIVRDPATAPAPG